MSDVAMRSRVPRTVSRCFTVLRQLRSIRRSVTDSVFHSQVVSLVMPRLDYGNATITVAALPASQVCRLQLVLNAVAVTRLIGPTLIFSVRARTPAVRPSLALQGVLVMVKSGRLELGDNIMRIL